MLKILSIGNSFSQDSQRYLHGVAESYGKEIHNVNLYIGGCSLERHMNTITDDTAEHTLEIHGSSTHEKIKIKDALTMDEWDYVTLQQVSTASFKADTYYPYVKELAEYVRKYAPKAKILMHETWSYESTRLPKRFGRTSDMFSRIEHINRYVAKDIGAVGVIPAGETLERLKERGLSVHSDGKHAGRGLGRYALALTWCAYLFGTDPLECTFNNFDVDVPMSYAKAARECAAETIAQKGECMYPIVATHDISYLEARSSDNPRQKLDIYFPDSKEFPVFVYFHGGGFVNGDKENSGGIAALAKYFTDHGIAFASANYRMYPNARYPDFLWDGAAAVVWIKKHLPEMGGNGKIFVGGSSAGGYLSMMLCFDKRYFGLFDMKPTDITGYIHDAGQPTTHFNVMRERGFVRKRVMIDDAAPIFYVGEAEKYSPMLFTEASNDLQNRKEQTDLMFSTLKHFGYDFDKIERYTFENTTHTSYIPEVDENGASRFGPVAYEFMKKYL